MSFEARLECPLLEFWVIPTFVVIEGEFLDDFSRFFGTLVTKFATSSVINFAFKQIRYMIIENLDLEPKIGAMMRDFLDYPRWEKLSKEMSSKILPSRDGSRSELEDDAVSLLKQFRKFFMAQDIGARAAIHIFNMIGFSIAKGVGAQIVSRLPSNLL
ncbi:hypothetical protein Tco_0824723 [Tanacetum coccineum]|uniref:Uncharacterized protein n=1 Tax=Tanacetum coccineum TaxID=301880 RepID=A0ABQ5AR77_9ASTR